MGKDKVKMASFLCTTNGVSPLLLFSFLILLTADETTNSALPLLNVQSIPGQLQPGFLFARLLGELTDTKNELVQCSNSKLTLNTGLSHGNVHDRRFVEDQVGEGPVTSDVEPTSTAVPVGLFEGCETSASDSTSSLTTFDNVKLVNVVRHRCIGKDLVSCLQTSRPAVSVMNGYSNELKRELDVACCKLQQCRHEDQQLVGNRNTADAKCQQMCFAQNQKVRKCQLTVNIGYRLDHNLTDLLLEIQKTAWIMPQTN